MKLDHSKNLLETEVLRGKVVESVHYGLLCVSDSKGGIILARGDSEKPIFPRSAIKAFQALPLVESGAAARFGLTASEIALTVSSHGGEEAHVEAARSMLNKAGREVGCLECGTHNPMHLASSYALAGRGEKATALNNNCSGKHAGFICYGVHEGLEVKGYVQKDHPIQQRITRSMEEMCEVDLSRQSAGVDGCSIPAFAMPLRSLAHGFAKFATGEGLSETRKQAAKLIRESVAAHPFYVAGTGRFCTRAMDIFGERAFVKTGAEGVYCASLPELGLGVALKCVDGATRAAEVMMAQVLAHYLKCSKEEEMALGELLNPKLKNWAGVEVGEVQIGVGNY